MIDLDICVGCHACAVNCKEWNSSGYHPPMTDKDPYGHDPLGVWFNRIHTFEEETDSGQRTVHFPKSCLHCEDAPCVTVCPTGASYKRSEDGIVLVDESKCIGCKLCSWACPYGAREFDDDAGVMKKNALYALIGFIMRTLITKHVCRHAYLPVLRVRGTFGDFADPDSNVSKLVKDRGGYDLMPEMECSPTNKYLPPRPRRDEKAANGKERRLEEARPDGVFSWLD